MKKEQSAIKVDCKTILFLSWQLQVVMASAPARQLNSKVGLFPLLFAIRVH